MPSDGLPLVYFVQAAGAGLVALTLLVAARGYDRPFLRSWAVSWAAAGASVAFGGIGLDLLRRSGQGEILGVMFSLAVTGKAVQLAWLAIGLRQLRGGASLAPRQAAALAGALGAGLAALVGATAPLAAPWRHLLRIGPAQAVGGLVFLYAARSLLPLRRAGPGVGVRLLALAFTLYALEEYRSLAAVLAAASGTRLPLTGAWIGLLDFFLHAMTASGAIALLLEEESARSAESTRRAETALAALEQRERRERLVLEQIDEVIWILARPEDDPAGPLRLVFLSGRVKDILGYEPDAFIRNQDLWRSVVHPDDLARVEAARRRIIRSRRPGWVEYRVRHRERGDYRWVEDRVAPQCDAAGAIVGVLGVARDITERKLADEALRRSEEQILHAQKMEAVGRLAGGIAHDFNNLLTVISGHTDLLLDSLPETDPGRSDAEAVRKAADRAAALVRQLLAFSRRQVVDPQVLDLGDILDELHAMLVRLIGEDIRLSTVVAPGVGRVRADRGQIEQVVVNLVVNARDAMPDGGSILIEVRSAGLRDLPALERLGLAGGEYVVLAVHDTGVGIDAETRARLFEPFFTTKPAGRGTGLGLATVYGIVRQSGGVVDVRSEAGRGASFAVYLPRADVEEQPAPPGEPARVEVRPERPATILVVEDEDAVRSLVVGALRSRGFRVLEAPDGAAALEIVERDEIPIDLLLADVVMPGMRGTELARLAVERRPGLRVAFMTGYAADALDRGSPMAGQVVLAKPFTAEALSAGVRRALGRDASGGTEPARQAVT
jgi:PAS domain S-box-containing protein